MELFDDLVELIWISISIQHFDSHGPSNNVLILQPNVVNQLCVYRVLMAYRPMTGN